MNTKRFLISVVAVFVFVFLYNFLLHTIVLADHYQQTAHLWRSQADQQDHIIWIIAGQALLSVMLCYVFIGGYQERGVGEGLRFGLQAGLLLAAPNLITYAVQPVPLALAAAWFIGVVVMAVGAGVILALTYRPPEAESSGQPD